MTSPDVVSSEVESHLESNRKFMNEHYSVRGRMKSLWRVLISICFFSTFIPYWAFATQKLQEQVRRNILKNNPADCERVLDMDFSKKQIFILCRTRERDLLQKVVLRSHLPKPIRINAEDRKSIFSIKEAFSKKGTKQKKVEYSTKKNRLKNMRSAPKFSLMKEDIQDIKSGLKKIWEQDTDTCRRFMANGMDKGEKFFIALCRLNN